MRRGNLRQSSGALDSSESDLSLDQLDRRRRSSKINGYSQASSSRSIVSFLPKSLIGTIIILGSALILIVLSQFTSSGSSGAGKEKKRRIKAVENRNTRPARAKAVSSSSSSGAAVKRQQTPLHPIGLTSPATNATLHIIFSTDCKHSSSHQFNY